jgi:hypothetical protein
MRSAEGRSREGIRGKVRGRSGGMNVSDISLRYDSNRGLATTHMHLAHTGLEGQGEGGGRGLT